jgi:hypothetical protein
MPDRIGDHHRIGTWTKEDEAKCRFRGCYLGLIVADAMGQNQPACQGEWKMCRKKK